MFKQTHFDVDVWMCFPPPTCDEVCSQLNYFWQESVNVHLNYSVVLQITSDTCILNYSYHGPTEGLEKKKRFGRTPIQRNPFYVKHITL